MGVMRRLLLTLACLFMPCSIQAETLAGRVVAITDGDTLVLQVDRQRRPVRIAGIDAPERVQPFGSRARASLGQWLFQKQVTADCPSSGNGGVPSCKVWVAGQDAGLHQLAEGMAWRDAGTLFPEDATAYQQAELMARLRRLGLWSETNPTPPWNWRKLTR